MEGEGEVELSSKEIGHKHIGESSKLILPVDRADSQSRANTSAGWSSPQSSGNGTSPTQTGTVKPVSSCSVWSTYFMDQHTDCPWQPWESAHQTYVNIFSESSSAVTTLTLSGRPSSRRFSFSLLEIVLTVSSTLGLVLLLLLSVCSSVPVGAASLWSVLVLHVSGDWWKSLCPLRPPSSDCLSFSSNGGQQFRKIWLVWLQQYSGGK